MVRFCRTEPVYYPGLLSDDLLLMDFQKIAIVRGSECPAEILRRICRDFDAELLGTLHNLREEDPFPGEEYGREVFIAKVVVQLGVKVSVIRVWIVVPGLLFDPEEPAQA